MASKTPITETLRPLDYDVLRPPRGVRTRDIWYLATPYSKHSEGLDFAAWEATIAAGQLAANGVTAFSPIVYTHQLARVNQISPLDHKYWLAFDWPFMELCRGLLVYERDGWRHSEGVAYELNWFRTREREIYGMRPADVDADQRDVFELRVRGLNSGNGRG